MSALQRPLELGGGAVQLQHRVVLAPLTRVRAGAEDLVPQEMSVEYYRQRATPGGFLITEASCISPEACGQFGAPGIWTDAHVAGWRRVTDVVHAAGARIFCQLWHLGRVSHPSWRSHPLLEREAAERGAPMPHVSASDVPMPGRSRTALPEGTNVPNVPPRALDTAELPRLVADYRHAARCALRAGFDGVEVHAGHGYLLDQFLRTGTNRRTDAYGGNPENRCRLVLEVLAALCADCGPGRVSVRLSPTQPGSMDYFGCTDENEIGHDGRHTTYGHLVSRLNELPLAYLLLTESRYYGGKTDDNVEKDPGMNMPVTSSATYRGLYKGVLIAAGGFTPASAEATVAAGLCDAVAFGRWFIANPDLPKRIRDGTPLNRYVRGTFYTHGEDGYVDYPDADGTLGKPGKYQTIEQASLPAPPPLPSKL